MLVIKGSAGVAPRVNLGKPLYTGDKAPKQRIHPGFETQGRHCQKSKHISDPTKRTNALQKLKIYIYKKLI